MENFIFKLVLSIMTFLLSPRSALAAAFTAAPVPASATSFPNLGGLIGQILTFALVLAGLLFFLYLLIGGLQWITSGGDKAGLESARGKITSALVGLVLVVGAYAIMKIIEAVFGVRVIGGINIQ